MRTASWLGGVGRVLMAGVGAWVLGWVFQAWRDGGLLMALVNGVYGCS
ncbi:hypothetical protein ACMHYJ_16090 [Castellaniella hirudinis]